MKKWKINRSLIAAIAIIAVFAILSFIAVYLLQGRAVDINGLITVQIEAQGIKENITAFRQDEEAYIFLPADAEYVTVNVDGDYTAEVNGLSVGVRHSVAKIDFDRKYAFSIKDKKEVSSGKLVFMQSETLPSLFIATDSGSMEYVHAVKGNAENGQYTLLDANGKNVSGKLLMQGRGNTSWTGCEKKGYKLTFDQTQSLLGLKPSNVYLLIANARSNYLSNTIAFWLSQQIGVKYVPQCKHIDLYLNGEYVGNYILCEQITVGVNSIDITDLEAQNITINPNQNVDELVKYEATDGASKGVLWVNEPDDVSGGFFLERDVPEYYKDEVSGFVLTSGDHFVIKGPKHAGQREVEYIKQYTQETYDALASADGYNPTTGRYYGEYLDIDSFVLKYTLEEFLNFNDAGRSSAYYYKDVNGKLCAGPGWDFEGAFKGNSHHITKLNATNYSTDWYEKLWQHGDFREKVKQTYQQLLVPALRQLIDQEFKRWNSQNASSAKMDMIRWTREDFDQNRLEITQWIEDRIAFLDEQWLSGNQYVTVTIESDWQNDTYLYLSPGDSVLESVMPQYVRDGFTFGGWVNKETGELFTFGQPIDADVTLQAYWVKENVSLIDSILAKVTQLLPELIFASVFGIAFMIFIVKFFIKEKKQ